jgi:hypothetical membrane protein
MGKRSFWGILSLSGIIGVAFYTLHVVLGGLLWNGYSHISQAISELTGEGAPNAVMLRVLTTIYGVLMIVFSVTVIFNFKTIKAKKLAMAGAVLLVVMETVSLIGYGLFPMNQSESAGSFQNIMHIVVTAIVVLCTIGSGYFIGIGLWKTEGIKRIGIFIFVCSIIITIFGALTPIAMANSLPFSGLTERINIFTLQIWLSVLSVFLFLRPGKRRIGEA